MGKNYSTKDAPSIQDTDFRTDYIEGRNIYNVMYPGLIQKVLKKMNNNVASIFAFENIISRYLSSSYVDDPFMEDRALKPNFNRNIEIFLKKFKKSIKQGFFINDTINDLLKNSFNSIPTINDLDRYNNYVNKIVNKKPLFKKDRQNKITEITGINANEKKALKEDRINTRKALVDLLKGNDQNMWQN